MPATGDGGQAAISLMPNVDGTHVCISESLQFEGSYVGDFQHQPHLIISTAPILVWVTNLSFTWTIASLPTGRLLPPLPSYRLLPIHETDQALPTVKDKSHPLTYKAVIPFPFPSMILPPTTSPALTPWQPHWPPCSSFLTTSRPLGLLFPPPFPWIWSWLTPFTIPVLATCHLLSESLFGHPNLKCKPHSHLCTLYPLPHLTLFS